MSALYVGVAKLFQSTLSVRRATALFPQSNLPAYISIHALRKESDQGQCHHGGQAGCISIHALRKESDEARQRIRPRLHISIHALRKESD